ncbi:MAG: cation:proton antiporter, partial [Methylococcales bacterium]|nr:cation:proton antiporter [Methylococcales bacterium]
LITVCMIFVGKSLFALGIVLVFRHPFSTALVIALSLAQIGEFSFILTEIGCKFGLLSSEAADLIVASAFISMIINPITFRFAVKAMPAKLSG